MNALVSFPRIDALPWVHVRSMRDPVRGIWGRPTKVLVPEGRQPPTLWELFAQEEIEDDDYADTLVARIDGMEIDRALWTHVRPKRGTFVTFVPPIRGKFGKIFGALAAIVLLAGALFIPGGWAGAPGVLGKIGAWGSTKMGKFILGLAAIGLNMVLQGLMKPEEDSKWEKQLGFASVDNEFQPGSPFKLWIGTFKDALQTTIPTFTEIDKDDQLATIGFSALGWFTPPKLYAGDVEMTTVQDREIVIWEAEAGDPPPPEVLMLVSNTKVERQLNIQLTEWEIEENDANENDDAQLLDGSVEETEPIWHMVETLDLVEDFRIEYLFNSLVHTTTGASANNNACFVILRHRMAIRNEDGSWADWVNLPQLCVRAKRASKAVRVQFYVHWVDAYPVPYINVLLHSDEANDSAWTKNAMDAFGSGSVVDTTDVDDPEGDNKAEFLRPTTASTTHYVSQTATGHSPNQTSTLQRWAKYQAGGPAWICLAMADAGALGNAVRAWFNIQTGVVGTVSNVGNGSGATAAIELGPNGWYLCKLTGKPNTSGSNTMALTYITTSNGVLTSVGDGVHGTYLWRAQLETGSTPHKPLVETTTATATSPTVGNAWPGSASGKDFADVMGWGDVFLQPNWTTGIALLNVSGDGFSQWWWESQEKVHLYLLKSIFLLGRYKFEVKRSWPGVWGTQYMANTRISAGSPVADPLYASYQTGEGGTAYWTDFFAPMTVPGESTLKVPANPARMQQSCSLTSVQNGWPEFPIQPKGTRKTHIFVRVKNQEIGTVRAIWTRLIDDWNGSAWVPDQPAQRPAAAYRDVLKGIHNANPVPDALIDNANIVDWYNFNETQDATCNMMLPGGGSVMDALRAIALCGYARPVYSPKHKVIIDRIREEGVVGLISSRSAAGFDFEMLLDEKPHGFDISYVDEFSDYEVKQVRAYAPGYNEDGTGGKTMATRVQKVDYPGLTRETYAYERGIRDLGWIYYRSMPLTCTQALAYREHEPGDLVSVETEILGRKAGRGRIMEITRTGGGDGFRDIPDVRDEMHPRFVRKGPATVSSIVIDEVPFFGTATGSIRREPDFRAIPDVRALDFPMGIEIKERNGNISVHEVSSADQETHEIVLATPALLDIEPGDEVITGKYGTISEPMLAWDIVPRGHKQAQIMLLPYAEQQIYYPEMPAAFELVTDPLFGGAIVYDGAPVWDNA